MLALSHRLLAIAGVGGRIRLRFDWTVDLFFWRDSAERIPPRLPRLSLAVMRDPGAVEVSVAAVTTNDGAPRDPSPALER